MTVTLNLKPELEAGIFAGSGKWNVGRGISAFRD